MTTKGRDAAKGGNVENIKKYLSGRWTSLDHWSVDKLKQEFKENISKELNNSSTLAVPVGELLK